MRRPAVPQASKASSLLYSLVDDSDSMQAPGSMHRELRTDIGVVSNSSAEPDLSGTTHTDRSLAGTPDGPPPFSATDLTRSNVVSLCHGGFGWPPRPEVTLEPSHQSGRRLQIRVPRNVQPAPPAENEFLYPHTLSPNLFRYPTPTHRPLRLLSIPNGNSTRPVDESAVHTGLDQRCSGRVPLPFSFHKISSNLTAQSPSPRRFSTPFWATGGRGDSFLSERTS